MSDASAERSAQAKLRGMAQRAEPLIQWYKANKPKVTVVRFSDDEYGLFEKFPWIASSYGFSILNGRVFFNGFACLPVNGERSTAASESKP